jgi:hypothetical protein
MGCQVSTRPFLQVQFCIEEAERPLLFEMLQGIARDTGMRLLDGSAELDAVAKRQRDITGIELA